LAATQFTDEVDIADVTTDKDTDKAIPNDRTQMAVPPNYVNKEFEATYTFEDQTEATTTRTDRLPSTPLHVLEEIDAEENIGARGNEQDSTAADVDHDLQHATNNVIDDVEVNLVFQVPPVQQHVSRNIQNGLDLWARIREYDQRMDDEGFTQVLTKSQKQKLKKQVIGTPYQTRAKDGPPPSSK